MAPAPLAAQCSRWPRLGNVAFLAAAGLVVIGDKYIDGYTTAELLGITMPEPADTERG